MLSSSFVQYLLSQLSQLRSLYLQDYACPLQVIPFYVDCMLTASYTVLYGLHAHCQLSRSKWTACLLDDYIDYDHMH